MFIIVYKNNIKIITNKKYVNTFTVLKTCILEKVYYLIQRGHEFSSDNSVALKLFDKEI